ncbi:MAG: hypothetical protein H7Z10_14125 [Gemmatimonadaceae bacterium]|nr:hypothetical protein [Acetobacteraceae bacterium]
MTGTSQTLTVSTTPPAATCTIDRVGERVGAIPSTPGSVRLDKSKNDLAVTCSKDGFVTATTAHASSFNGATFGNILIGGLVGVVVDASSGANFNYPTDIRMDLAANAAPVLAPETGPYTPGGPIRLGPVAALEDGTPMIQPISAVTTSSTRRALR